MPRIRCEEKLSRCEEEQLGVRVPVPLNRLVGALCEAAEDTGTPGAVTRKEMVAAILFDATREESLVPERLVEMLLAYRTAVAESRMPRESHADGYLDYDELKPGRPRRR